jgi:Heterokaryon incompatibility protein (HET)
VNRLSLVPAEPQQRYLALSYVWGTEKALKTVKRNIDRLQRPGSILLTTETTSQDENTASSNALDSCPDSTLEQEPVTPPKTIQDAIQLTRLIGEKFLWVDSLCIVQDDKEDVKMHLDGMGSIYANAYATIVAAVQTAFWGLRGIEHVTPPMDRKRALAAFLESPDSLHDKIRMLHDRLQACTWSRRAWTFQEQIFSRRLIILDYTEVSWICHCAVWFERMPVIEGQCDNNREVVAQGFAFGVEPNLWEYAQHIEQYNRRDLTYPEDALNAMGGILTTLSSVFVGGFICGLPSMYFNAALLWYNKAPLERRHARSRDAGIAMPPSWAWAAWAGKTLYREHAKKSNSVLPLVQWKYKANGDADWELIQSIEYEVPKGINTELAEELRSQDPKGIKKENSLIPIPDYPHLLFARPQRLFIHGKEKYGDVLLLLDGGNGMLTACEPLNRATKPNDMLCEVVAISVLTDAELGKEMYNVLWIEWKDGIAYRKGIGWISKAAWSSKPTERIDLILG